MREKKASSDTVMLVPIDICKLHTKTFLPQVFLSQSLQLE